jgi:hypothetical protein
MTKKIGVFVTSNNMDTALYDLLSMDGYRVLLLTGEDEFIQNGMIMRDIKKRYFQRPDDILRDYDICIWSSSMTAGVSIEEIGVDLMIGCYNARTCSPVGYVQGLHRIRKQTLLELYQVPGNDNSNYADMIPMNVYSSITNDGIQTPWKAIEIMSKCLMTQLQCQRDYQTVRMLIQELGYTIRLEEYEQLEADERLSSTRVSMVERIIEDKWIPQQIDMDIYNILEKDKELTDAHRKHILEDKYDCISKHTIINLMGIYKITPDILHNMTMEDVQQMIKYRYTYRKWTYLSDKYSYKDPSEYQAAIHDKHVDDTKFNLNMVISMNHRIKNCNVRQEIETKRVFDIFERTRKIIEDWNIRKQSEPDLMSHVPLTTFDEICKNDDLLKTLKGRSMRSAINLELQKGGILYTVESIPVCNGRKVVKCASLVPLSITPSTAPAND